ncbi:hypothetical protein MHTCC0001_19670 [Flavobacteriaceae bacterium MHTCC 0001]
MELGLSKNNYKIRIQFIFLLVLFILLPILNWGFGINEQPYFIAITGLWGLFNFITNRTQQVVLTSVDIWVAVFIVYQIAHFALLGNVPFFEMTFWWRLSFVLIYFILKDSVNNDQNTSKKGLVFLLLFRFGIELCIGTLQYFDIIDISISEHFKVAGTFSSTNHYAICLSVGLITMLLQLKKSMQQKLFYIMAFIAGLASVLLIIHTKSRSAFLGLITALAVCFILKEGGITKFNALSKALKTAIVTLLIVILGLGGYALYGLKKDSANGRVFAARMTLGETIKKPIFGHGLFRFEAGYNSAKSNYFNKETRVWDEIKIGNHIDHAMNDYLEISYEIGLVGLILLILIILKAFKAVKNYDKYAYIGIAVFTVFIVAAVFTTLYVNAFFIIAAVFALYLIIDYYTIIKIKKVYKYKLFTLVASLLILAVGGAKIYGSYWEKSQRQNPENKVASSNWELWSKIMADKGQAQFVFGSVLHKTYNQKLKALRVMEQGVMKNKRPENVRKLALYHAHNGNLKKAEQLLVFNIGNEPFLFEPRHDLAVIYQKTGQHKKYVQMLKTIIDFPEKVPSQKVTDLKNDAKKRLKEALKEQ